MTTPIQQKIRDKKRTSKQIADMVKSGDWINLGAFGGESRVLFEETAKRLGPEPGQLKDIEYWTHAIFNPHPEIEEIDPMEKYHTLHVCFFFAWERMMREKYGVIDWRNWGWAMGTEHHHYRFGDPVREKRGMDWCFTSSSKPNSYGFFNFSYGTSDMQVYSQMSKKIVLEVREDYPWAEGGENNLINIDEVDYWVEVDCEKYSWPQMDEHAIKPSSEEIKIAEHIMTIMRDRDVIQLGIGSLPTAVVAAMAEAGFKDLGIHTEMLNFGLLKMIESGQVTNKFKNIDRGKSVWTFALPFMIQYYYDMIDHNPTMAVYDIDYTNNIHQLSRVDNIIGIDNAVMMDLYGQVSCSHTGDRIISSTGGFFNFITFCPLAKGGRSVVSMTSRDKNGKSRFNCLMPKGMVIDVPSQFVNYVCTEYGIVNCWGLSGYERAEALISIAHPDDREELEREARKNKLLPPNFPVSMHVKPGETRRYPTYEARRKYKLLYASRSSGCEWLDDGDMFSGR